MNRTADVHTLVGAYVLDALDQTEAALVEDHLAACPACSDEVVELRTVTSALAADAAAAPPAWLRADLLTKIDQIPQLPPREALSLPDLTPAPAPLPAQTAPTGPALFSLPAHPNPQPQPQPQPHPGPGPEPQLEMLPQPPSAPSGRTAQRRRQPSRRPLVGLAAALAAVCLGLGFVVTEQRADLQAEQARVEALSALTDAAFDSPSAVAVEGGGQVAVVRTGDRSLLVTRGLPNLPPDKTYQLWLVDETSTIRSVGMLRATENRQDERLLNLAGLTSKDTKLCVTVEPSGGSMQPTTPVLAAVALNARQPN